MKNKKSLLIIAIGITILNIIPLAYSIAIQSMVGIIFGLVGLSAGIISINTALRII